MDLQTYEKFEQNIISTWEEVFKKGQLTMWILLALKNGQKHMGAIKEFIDNATNKTMAADDQSMYRALRRFLQMELVDYQEEPSDQGGPARKVYSLTETGARVLQKFVNRNIAGIFYKPEIIKLLEGEK